MTLFKNQSGFALLLTLVVVSVVLAIGLSLLNITIKQLILSGTARDSEIAFHASYAGAECAQYWRLIDFEPFMQADGSAFSLNNCLQNTDALSYSGTKSTPASDPPSKVHLSQYEMTWGPDTSPRCTEIDLYLFDARQSEAQIAANATQTVKYDIVEYRESEEETCSNTVCTVILSRGFNRACDDTGSLRTVQREIVLEY